MTDHTFIAWIDESGDDGDKFGTGSSEFLVLSAVIGYEALAVNIDAAFDIASLVVQKPSPWKSKFIKTHDGHKWLVCSLLGMAGFHSAHILVHKHSIRDKRLRTDKNRLYSFVSKFLVERISWVCAHLDHPYAPGNRKCKIVFSEDKSRSYESFKDYVRKLQKNYDHNNSINWRYVHPDMITVEPANAGLGLMAADYHASAHGAALERKRHGATDDRFARLLCHTVHRDPEYGIVGIGYKLWPKDAESLVNHDSRLEWIRRI